MKIINNDMYSKYDNYINEHKHNVVKGYNWIKDNVPDILDGIDIDTLDTTINNHDASKTSASEYIPYVNYFYADKNNPEYVRDFQQAWLHHVHNNCHHWNYWVLVDDDGIVALDMPDIYIIEMICDWWSFSWKKGKLLEIFDWYDKHLPNMKLSKLTQNKVETILNRIHETLMWLK